MVFDYGILIVTRGGLHFTRPFHDHRFADAAFVHRPFSAVERRVVRMKRQVAPLRFRRQTAVIAHKNNDGIIVQLILFQPIHQIAQTLVHSFNKRGISRLFFRKPCVAVFLVEPHILIHRHVNGVVRHIKEEGLVEPLGFIERFDGFQRERFGGEGFGSPIVFQPGNGVEGRGTSVGAIPVITLAQIACQSTGGMPRDIHFKTKVMWIFARRIDSSPMRFSAMNGVITAVFEQLG